MWTTPRRSFPLTAALGSLAAATAVTGVLVVTFSRPGTAPFEVAKWLLQLSVVLVGAGLITSVLRQADLARAKRESWTTRLQDVVAANETVVAARLLLQAHATAKTYSEQIQRLVEVRASLRRITAGPDLHEAPQLREKLKAMQKYIEDLVREYERKYLRVARQQRLDEAVLTFHLKSISEQSTLDALPALPPVLGDVLAAGRMLQDPAEFPLLSALRSSFDSSDFRRAYKEAKPLLEERAGVKRTEPGPD